MPNECIGSNAVSISNNNNSSTEHGARSQTAHNDAERRTRPATRTEHHSAAGDRSDARQKACDYSTAQRRQAQGERLHMDEPQLFISIVTIAREMARVSFVVTMITIPPPARAMISSSSPPMRKSVFIFNSTQFCIVHLILHDPFSITSLSLRIA